MKYNEILQELRKDRALTQTELAKILNTTQRTISNWESGRNEPPYDFLIKYAKYFNVSTDYILGLTKEDRPYWIKNQLNITGQNKIHKIEIK
ncbi:helix-turn-helix domain-containing protein [Ruminococcus sp.]|mgnify:FL=1|uniref:helix-turn-helix domain-containing protein n=1 Tax=Ruminococcus sp. TaxID=41978 RepID=UPI004026FF56